MKEVNQILLDLKRKIFKPVYFLCGEETWYIDLLSDYIEKNILDEGDREFNQHIVYGKDLDLLSVISLARQFPMMSEHQVVIVKEAQNLRELGRGGGDDDEGNAKPAAGAAQQLLAYVQNPQPTTILVFCYKYKTPDKRSALVKALQKNAVFLETKKMYDNQLPDWISGHVTEKGYKISPKSAFLMAEFLGNDLAKIDNEINKLIINLKAGEEISTELIQNNIGISKEYNIFELQNALGKRDVLRANQIVNYFSSNEKEHPMVMTVSSLYGYFSKILRYHFLADKNKFAAAQELGVNPFFVDGYAQAAAVYNTSKLKQIFSLLKEYDLKSKGVENASTVQGELLKEMVFRIMH
jgi:DNA polymerase III subunit delta